MPDWTRLTLLRALPPAAAERARAAYKKLLEQMVASHKFGGIGIGHQHRFTRGLRAAVGQRATTAERVAWDFLRRNELELEVPTVLARLIRPRLNKAELTVLIAGAVCALGIILFPNQLLELLFQIARTALLLLKSVPILMLPLFGGLPPAPSISLLSIDATVPS
jgi:hypothetical protein